MQIVVTIIINGKEHKNYNKENMYMISPSFYFTDIFLLLEIV